jgi:uncharacterized SAM-binding protein YcdF (DUF218 family)
MTEMAFSKHTKNYTISRMDDSRKLPVRIKRIHRLPVKRIVGYCIALTIVAFIAGFGVFCRIVARSPGHIHNADGIVALTGGEARIPTAVRLLADGKAKRLLISGVNPSTTRRELIRLVPDSKTWFRCCIDVDRVARDTISNANETKDWVEKRQFHSIIVVTASYHMPRSLAELRRAMPDTDLYPYPVVPRSVNLKSWWTDKDALLLLMSEYVKFLPTLSRCVVMQVSHGNGIIGGTRRCINGSQSG